MPHTCSKLNLIHILAHMPNNSHPHNRNKMEIEGICVLFSCFIKLSVVVIESFMVVVVVELWVLELELELELKSK